MILYFFLFLSSCVSPPKHLVVGPPKPVTEVQAPTEVSFCGKTYLSNVEKIGYCPYYFSLEPLQHFTHLRELYIQYPPDGEFKWLNHLPLKQLNIIMDEDGSLERLTHKTIESVEIEVFRPVQSTPWKQLLRTINLEQLKVLRITGVPIEIEHLVAPQLEELHAVISSTSELSTLNHFHHLKDLFIMTSHSNIALELAFLERIEIRSFINLDSVNLEKCSQLKSLNLGLDLIAIVNGVDNRTKMADAQITCPLNLKELIVGTTNFQSFQQLHRCEHIQTLNATSTQISNIDELNAYPSLQTLRISDTEVSSLDALKNLSELKVLEFSGTKVSSLEPLRSLSNLEELSLAHNLRIRDLNIVASLPKLKILHSIFTRIRNLNGLCHHPSLEIVSLGYNRSLRDLSCLKEMPNLKKVYISMVPIPQSLQEELCSKSPPVQIFSSSDDQNLCLNN